MRANEIVSSQIEHMETKEKLPVKHSSAGEAKIRYIAGACSNKISSRLRNSVLRKIGKTSKKSKIARTLDYKKHAMLKKFRIEEDEAPQNSSMSEIESKQGTSRGLTIVNDDVFNFFIQLNGVVQHNCTFEHFHIHGHKTFHFCRNSIDSDIELLNSWINLFGGVVEDNIEEEIFLILVMELFKDITEHFVRIAFVDALKAFKASVPRKKKQALRSKIKAIGERDNKKKKISNDNLEVNVSAEGDEIYKCNTCNNNCDWDPADTELESLACDKCNCWYHYKCAKLTGKEAFLSKKKSTWYCCNCSKKGKSKGKGKKK